jgi:hypothetical protein
MYTAAAIAVFVPRDGAWSSRSSVRIPNGTTGIENRFPARHGNSLFPSTRLPFYMFYMLPSYATHIQPFYSLAFLHVLHVAFLHYTHPTLSTRLPFYMFYMLPSNATHIQPFYSLAFLHILHVAFQRTHIQPFYSLAFLHVLYVAFLRYTHPTIAGHKGSHMLFRVCRCCTNGMRVKGYKKQPYTNIGYTLLLPPK